MRTKFVVVMVILLFSICSTAFAQSHWKDRKAVWDPLLEDKASIALMTGGDVNGDYVDDVVLIYRGGPNQGLVALISERTGYQTYRFQGNRLDLIYNTELAQARTVRVRNGTIDVLCPFKGAKLLSGITANEEATVSFRFLENTLKMTGMVFNGAFESDGTIAQVWFDATIGQVYVENLAEAEVVGGDRNYRFRYYYRLVAYPVDRVAIDGNDEEWVLFSYPVYLKNSPVGNPITYGFEKWKSDFDISAKLSAGYDRNNLYFFIDISDDVVNQAFSGDTILRGDHVELWFANASGEKVQIGVSPGNFKEILPEARLWYRGNRAVSGRGLEDVQIAAKQTESGYMLECAIPFALLPEGYLRIGANPFSVTISDSDQSKKQEKLLSSSSLQWGDQYSLGELIFQK